MASTNTSFVGSIPHNYDHYMGPVMFEPYAADIVSRLRVPASGRVLEVACGTGIVTRRMRQELPASVTILATDLNQPMLDYAGAKPGMLPGVEWRQADACALPFPDQSFDAVVCQFGLMFVPDRTLALAEARRVLRAGGQLLLSVWDSMECNPFTLVAHTTVASLYPVDPPLFFAVPFSMGDRAALETMATAAGFESVSGHTVTLQGMSPSARSLATGLVEGSPLSIQIRDRAVPTIEVVVDQVTEALARLGGDSPFRCTLQAHLIDGRVAG
ncbi:MAG: methyltransferase domain-containing protein [Gemmatimonadota bacterium]